MTWGQIVLITIATIISLNLVSWVGYRLLLWRDDCVYRREMYKRATRGLTEEEKDLFR